MHKHSAGSDPERHNDLLSPTGLVALASAHHCDVLCCPAIALVGPPGACTQTEYDSQCGPDAKIKPRVCKGDEPVLPANAGEGPNPHGSGAPAVVYSHDGGVQHGHN